MVLTEGTKNIGTSCRIILQHNNIRGRDPGISLGSTAPALHTPEWESKRPPRPGWNRVEVRGTLRAIADMGVDALANTRCSWRVNGVRLLEGAVAPGSV